MAHSFDSVQQIKQFGHAHVFALCTKEVSCLDLPSIYFNLGLTTLNSCLITNYSNVLHYHYLTFKTRAHTHSFSNSLTHTLT